VQPIVSTRFKKTPAGVTALSGLLNANTDPAIRAQVEKVLKQELDKIYRSNGTWPPLLTAFVLLIVLVAMSTVIGMVPSTIIVNFET
jgi:hypothetical protein